MGVLDGLEVMELSPGITGPLTGMLLSDHGARVTRIEPPGGDPWRHLSGYRVWNRGKRSAILDLKDPTDRDRFLALAASADVLIDSFAPGKAERLGIDDATLRPANPRLIHCSITGYGPDGPHAHRPALDALVAARTGHQWEARGVTGGTIGRLSGTAGMMPGLEAPPGCWVGPDRDGPLFSGVPWVSLAAFYIATVGINAAIRARELTGRGQQINVSLLHGVLATTVGPWQQAERPDTPFFETWVIDPRAPKGFFRAADDRWLHHWVPLPEFILGAADNGMRGEGLPGPRAASMRISTAPEEMVVLHTYQDQLAEAVARYPSDAWVRLAAEVGVPVQPVRSPEEALLDPLLLAEGCVTEVDDPELGPIRQVGRVVSLDRHPSSAPSPSPAPGQHTAEVISEADALRRMSPPTAGHPSGPTLASPLEGVLVLDLGLAVAGPFGTQVLAQLGARVIKVSTTTDKFWFTNHIAMCCNRDKESITLNLKHPDGLSILHRLVERADVVQHNMRYDAAGRLGIDYESLRQVNPALIYCHTIGHEHGAREQDPGNDQTAAALAGCEWLDGGLDRGGRPIWSCTSLGDTGNGFLSAIGVIQALYHRARTGEAQSVDTSILNAGLLVASMAALRPDGTPLPRPRLDQMQLGLGPLYRLYETSDGWACIAALTPDHREALAAATWLDINVLDATHLEPWFRARRGAEVRDHLDAHGVPCELCDPDFGRRIFDDPEMDAHELVVHQQHPKLGSFEHFGTTIRFSDTPGRIWGPPPVCGQHTRQIMHEHGFEDTEIDKLVDAQAVFEEHWVE